MSILLLTLKKEAFDIMITGEKKFEIRQPSKWMLSRVFDFKRDPRKYETVRFTNGYGRNRPWFECEYIGARRLSCDHEPTYQLFSNGLKVEFKPGDIVIELGKVLSFRL